MAVAAVVAAADDVASAGSAPAAVRSLAVSVLSCNYCKVQHLPLPAHQKKLWVLPHKRHDARAWATQNEKVPATVETPSEKPHDVRYASALSTPHQMQGRTHADRVKISSHLEAQLETCVGPSNLYLRRCHTPAVPAKIASQLEGQLEMQVEHFAQALPIPLSLAPKAEEQIWRCAYVLAIRLGGGVQGQ